MSQVDVTCRLRQAGVENAAHEARLLCEALSGQALEKALIRRCEGYPLQYLLGEWDFYRQTYEVNEHCLIPRSDTEILVEQAIKLLPTNACFLDLCTGSGCIAVSTLCERQDTSAVAVDLFEPTLALAARNAQRNGVAMRVVFQRADVLAAPIPQIKGGFDAILSNPPYIRNDVVPTLQREIGYEPPAALLGGEDGLDFYRAILQQWQTLLTPTGFFLLEIGYDQADDVTALGAAQGFSATVYRDYGGNDRVVLLRR